MNCVFLTWNVMGLGRPEKLRLVVKTINRNKASIVFIQESKLQCMKSQQMNRLKGSKFEMAFSPSVGTAGGLILLWDPKIFQVQRCEIVERIVVLIGKILKINARVAVINVYAPNNQRERKDFWVLLSNLIASLQLPIVLAGDFNAVKSSDERFGMAEETGAMHDFSMFIRDNGLIDLPLHGFQYTWVRRGNIYCASRLDRFLLSPEIIVWLPKVEQKALPRSLSDHHSVLLAEVVKSGSGRPFKWFSHWADNPDYAETIVKVCRDSENSGAVNCLRQAKIATKEWVREENERK
ncbi:hypothetical protein HRI_002047100 [Hibiscus trionum]|uniref:Endonuclease/exonuclease/phosphatase domain-containing protein n=1 Tax=Hibiscus trionum TaxID=183268 RepID=A0A9W7M142_HIBTR|nr:hypothetical protein HRI_002047100 [Hibiscus trionum]